VSEVLVLAPLQVEAAALRGSGRILLTGMGRTKARIAAARALAIEAPGVVVAGVAGAVAPGLLPGDVVCATHVRGDDGAEAVVPGSALLAAALECLGLRVHVGAIASSSRLLPSAERAQLDGVLAVDMESAWLAAAAGERPFAVLRAIADPAGRRLADPRIVPEGVRALQSLRRSRAAIVEWAAGDTYAPDIVEHVYAKELSA
jgi:4-hydroxy-3-methylbut-2-enyl diphosphate reductase